MTERRERKFWVCVPQSGAERRRVVFLMTLFPSVGNLWGWGQLLSLEIELCWNWDFYFVTKPSEYEHVEYKS